MAAQAQAGTKRQKVREVRGDTVDYFQGIDKVEYNNMASPTDTTSYRHYNSGERAHSRAMEDWLKFSVSLTEFRSNGSDSHGRSTLARPWDDQTDTLENHKRGIKALFDFCAKLGVKYWTAFDTDLVPIGDRWEQDKAHWDEIVEYILDLSQRCHVKLLWLAPDLHSHPKYASGALTSNDATTFIQATCQIKKCLEVSQRLSAEAFLLWPFREGYEAIFQTDLSRELKSFAKLLKITAEYKDRLNYRCQLLIMPYYNCNYRNYNGGLQLSWRESDSVKRYMWDVTSCLYFLKNFNLDRHYKVCCPPGHHMYMANVYNMLGGVTLTNDFDQFNIKELTLMMKCIVDQGAAPPGGIHLKLSARRGAAGELRELVAAHVKRVDAVAKGLRVACNLLADQTFSKHVQQRYATYCGGIGSRLVSGDVSMEDCEDYYKKNQSSHNEVTCSRIEHLEVVFQRHLDACDHV